MKKGRLKRGLALFLSTVTLSMSVIPHLPPDILMTYAKEFFHMSFHTSTSHDGHLDIKGQIPGQPETDFLCMLKGASASSKYKYYKTNNDVSYSDGSIEDKRMFWAYLLTYGNTTGIHADFPDHSIESTFGTPFLGNTSVAKQVAWSHGKENGGDPRIDSMANDGFMQLENIPAGCKSPQDIFNSVSKYGTPETAISMDYLKSGPGEFDAKKLYDMAGLQDWATFRKYCTIYNKMGSARGIAPLPHISSHILRHTACTRLAMEGINPKALQYIMGHSNAAITMDIYNHLNSKDYVRSEINVNRIKDALYQLCKTC